MYRLWTFTGLIYACMSQCHWILPLKYFLVTCYIICALNDIATTIRTAITPLNNRTQMHSRAACWKEEWVQRGSIYMTTYLVLLVKWLFVHSATKTSKRRIVASLCVAAASWVTSPHRGPVMQKVYLCHHRGVDPISTYDFLSAPNDLWRKSPPHSRQSLYAPKPH